MRTGDTPICNIWVASSCSYLLISRCVLFWRPQKTLWVATWFFIIPSYDDSNVNFKMRVTMLHLPSPKKKTEHRRMKLKSSITIDRGADRSYSYNSIDCCFQKTAQLLNGGINHCLGMAQPFGHQQPTIGKNAMSVSRFWAVTCTWWALQRQQNLVPS